MCCCIICFTLFLIEDTLIPRRALHGAGLTPDPVVVYIVYALRSCHANATAAGHPAVLQASLHCQLQVGHVIHSMQMAAAACDNNSVA